MAVESPGRTAGDQGRTLKVLDPSGDFRIGEPVGLVVDRDSHFAQLVLVLPRVMSAEEKFSTAGELDSHVGLSTAAVAAVNS